MISLAETPSPASHPRALHRSWASAAAGTGSPARARLRMCRCQRPARQSAVCGGVAVAADDGHAGLGQSQFRADDMDDAALGTIQPVERNAELGRVLSPSGESGPRRWIRNRQGWVMRGRGMVHRGEGFSGPADFQSALAQTGEGLRRGHLVDEVQVNIEDGRGVGLLGNNVRIPDFFEEGFWHNAVFSNRREHPEDAKKIFLFSLANSRSLRLQFKLQ